MVSRERVQDRLIDLDKVVATKFKGKKLPRFVVNFFKRFIHQDWLNEVLSRGYDGAEFCEDTLKYMDIKIEVEGLENVPKDGTLYTFASNHPLGAADGLALCALISREFGKVCMPVNDFLMFFKPLAPLCVPINKTGNQVRNLPQLMDDAFRSDDQIMIFPAGVCSRRIQGRIQDFPWTKTFITKSVEYQRDVVPIHFSGQNSNFFYRLANFSDRFLPFNLAMLFLVDEMYKNVHKSFRVAIGKPIPWQTFDQSRTPLEWAKYVEDCVYKL